jgi:hypothetical protein
MPEEFCFNIQQKEAEAFLGAHVQLTTGMTYPLTQLKKLPLSKLARSMGKDFAEAISENGKLNWDKFAEIAPTLPRDDARLLEKLIKAAAESASEEARESIPPEALQQLLNVIVSKGQGINDMDVHATAEQMGLDPHEAEEAIYRTLAGTLGGKNDIIPGGKAKGVPASAFPQDQIQKGVQVEQEHTNNPAIAQEIAKDHLTEAKDYYDPRLDKMEKTMEKDKEQGKTEGVENTEKGEDEDEGEESGEGEEKAARVDPTKFTAKSTERLFQAMGHDVEDGDTTDFKKIIQFKTGR